MSPGPQVSESLDPLDPLLRYSTVPPTLSDLGGVPGKRPPKGPDSFVFTYKIFECNRLGSPRRPMRFTPHFGKSWIRHCPNSPDLEG